MAANAGDARCPANAATLQSLGISTDPANGNVDITAWGLPFIGAMTCDMTTCVQQTGCGLMASLTQLSSPCSQHTHSCSAVPCSTMSYRYIPQHGADGPANCRQGGEAHTQHGQAEGDEQQEGDASQHQPA